MKALLIIVAFIFLIFIKNLAFWSTSQTFFFGDTAIYSLHLAALSKNLTTLVNPKDSMLLWNPNYLSVGLPTLSVIDYGLLYPPNLLVAAAARLLGSPLLVFPLYHLAILAHLAFGSFFVYKILKEFWGLESYSSLIGGLMWLFIGFNTEFMAAAPIMMAGSYLPLFFYLILKNKRKDLKYRVLFFTLLATNFLIGYPMVSLIVYTFCLAAEIFTETNLNRDRVIKVLGKNLLGLILITLPIITPLYLTSYLNLPYSIRSSLKLDGFLQNPAPLFNLSESTIPKNTPFNSRSTANIVYIYLSLTGILVLLQGGSAKELTTDKRNVFLIMAGLAGLILALGAATTIPGSLYFLLPGINLFRRLSVFSLIPGFVFCLLVPTRIKSFFAGKNLSRASIFWLKVLVILILYAQVLSILNARPRENMVDVSFIFQGLFISLIITSLAFIAFFYNPTYPKLARYLLLFTFFIEAGVNLSSKAFLNSKIDPKQIFKPNALIQNIKSKLKPGQRVDLLQSQHNYSTDFLDFEQTAGYLSLASRYGVEINEALNNPIYKKDNLRDVLGVKLVVRKGEVSEPSLERIFEVAQGSGDPEFYVFNYLESGWEAEPPGSKYSVYENSNPLPRVFLADGLNLSREELSKETLKEIEVLKSPKTVIIKKDEMFGESISDRGELSIEEYRRNYLKAKIKTPQTSFLANATAFYPGWTVKINGDRVKPVQTNWFMMGVFVPPGENIIEFSYLPKTIVVGLIYLGGAGVTLILLGKRIFAT